MRSLILPCAAAAALFAVAPKMLSWHERHVMPEGTSGGGAAFLSGELVMAGGTVWRDGVKHWLTSTYVYDRREDAWTLGPALPEPLAYGASVRTERSLEVLGGGNESGVSHKCWRLDAGASKWVECGDLPAGSLLGTGASVDGQAYLFGGCDDMDLNHCSSAVLKRDAKGSWNKVSEIPGGAIAMFASAVLHDQVYLFGGCEKTASGAHNSDRAFRYDAKKNEWKTLKPVPAAARGMNAVPLDGRHVLLIGGYTNSTAGFTDAEYVYDTVEDRYEPAVAFPVPIMGMAVLQHGGSIWALGGEDKARHRSARMFEAKLP